jgi:hypothetical protein
MLTCERFSVFLFLKRIRHNNIIWVIVNSGVYVLELTRIEKYLEIHV